VPLARARLNNSLSPAAGTPAKAIGPHMQRWLLGILGILVLAELLLLLVRVERRRSAGLRQHEEALRRLHRN
jgi:hypothetical protein